MSSDESYPLLTNQSYSVNEYNSCNKLSFDERFQESVEVDSVAARESRTLRRDMQFHHCFAFVVGCMIGAGIFISPSLVAQYTPNFFVSILAWILAGGLALLGALCYCEMVSVVKKTGASYIFILDCYGKVAGFTVNWTNSIIFAPCDAAILLITIGLYACAPFFSDHSSVEYHWCSRLVGLVAMVIIASINCLGAKKSGIFQIGFMSIQVLMFSMIIGMGIYSASTTNTYRNLLPEKTFNNTFWSLKNELPAFGVAIFNALYCFDGYATIAYVAEEAVNPSKTIPLITFTSIPFVTFVYLLINIGCAAVLSHQQIAASNTVVFDVAIRVGGSGFRYFMPIAVAVCIVPALSAVFYNLPRLIMSSAREGQFPSMFSLIHKDRRTPIPAICFLTVLTILITLSDISLQTLIQCCNISIWFEYVFAISTILTNRWKRPNLQRAYRTWITTPIIMIIIPVILLVLSLIERPVSTLVIIAVMATSFPVYYVFLYRKLFNSILPNTRISLLLLERFPLVKCEVNETSM